MLADSLMLPLSPSTLSSAKDKSIPASPKDSEKVSQKLRVLDNLPSDGHPLSLVTLYKVLENSDSTKSSRMFTKKLLEKKMLTDIKKSDGRLPLDQLKLLLILFSALGKP